MGEAEAGRAVVRTGMAAVGARGSSLFRTIPARTTRNGRPRRGAPFKMNLGQARKRDSPTRHSRRNFGVLLGRKKITGEAKAKARSRTRMRPAVWGALLTTDLGPAKRRRRVRLSTRNFGPLPGMSGKTRMGMPWTAVTRIVSRSRWTGVGIASPMAGGN